MLLLVLGCAAFQRTRYDARLDSDLERNRLVIWMLSDIQPKTISARKDFEHALADVAAHVPGIDVALIAGDLLMSRSTAEDFEWFIQTQNRAAIPAWFELAGNHDLRNQKLFRQYFPKPAHYAVSVGNVLILMLSDETPSPETNISTPAFEWWKSQVLAHPDRIILTVTHAPLRHSGLFTATVANRRIENSQPFEEVLPQARVTLWASGHSHLPQKFYRTAHVNPKLGGTCFLNVSAIRKETWIDSQSRILIFTEGSRTLWIRSRNHTTAAFNPNLDVALTLDRPFQGDGAGARIVAE